MEAHGEDLRAEGAPDDLVEALKKDWSVAPLPDTDRSICRYAAKLTQTPAAMNQQDIADLRRAGLDDQAIHDVCAVTAYFAYINRMADGLGVDLEPEMKPMPSRSDEDARP